MIWIANICEYVNDSLLCEIIKGIWNVEAFWMNENETNEWMNDSWTNKGRHFYENNK